MVVWGETRRMRGSLIAARVAGTSRLPGRDQPTWYCKPILQAHHERFYRRTRKGRRCRREMTGPLRAATKTARAGALLILVPQTVIRPPPGIHLSS